MKQKLLNSFTWRGTLLVALLCTSFGNAWADWHTSLTTSEFTNSLTTSDDVTWDVSSSVYSGGDGINNFGASKKQYGVTSVKFTTSDIKGTITKIEVTAKGPKKKEAVVKVGTTSFDSKNAEIGTSSTTHTFTPSSGVYYCDKEEISFEINYGSHQNHGIVTISSIKVTYMPCAEIPIKAACNDGEGTIYGTFSYPEAFVVPSGLTVEKVSVSDGTLAVNSLSNIIPANTGVMVSYTSTSDVSVPVFLTPNAGEGTVANTDGNMLRPTGDNGITATAMGNADPGRLFYYLTMNGSQIGFYRRNNDGSAFDMNTNTAKNKAYLAVPSNQVGNVKGFEFSDTVDGIKAVETEKAESNAIYNLAGQRVSKMQKGIYVVNGKKMIRR